MHHLEAEKLRNVRVPAPAPSGLRSSIDRGRAERTSLIPSPDHEHHDPLRLGVGRYREGQISECGEHRPHLPEALSAIAELLSPMPAMDPPTTITIRSSTRLLLESMKGPGETYDELLQNLAEEYYPPKVIAELKRRVADVRAGRVRGVPAAEMRRRLGV